MSKYILRHGCNKPSDEAYICPDCGHREEKYKLVEQAFSNPNMTGLRCGSTGMPLVNPLVPTFTCAMCGCVWQWESDQPKQHKEENNANPM